MTCPDTVTEVHVYSASSVVCGYSVTLLGGTSGLQNLIDTSNNTRLAKIAFTPTGNT